MKYDNKIGKVSEKDPAEMQNMRLIKNIHAFLLCKSALIFLGENCAILIALAFDLSNGGTAMSACS
jgi:hypothetical protein